MIRQAMQWTCIFTLTTLTLAAQSSTSAVAAVETLRTFGMIGLAEGQTARLNLLNPGVPAPGAAAAMCSAAVSFVDAQGTVLKSATVNVMPGQSSHLDVDSDADLKLAVDERHEIRATFQLSLPCRLIPTLEIFDTVSGKTTAILGRARFLRDPSPTAASN